MSEHAAELVQIEKPLYGGAFLAHAAGKAVFVPLALPGEQARVRVTEAKRGYAAAEIEEIVVASAERIAPQCRHFGACGGCAYQHADYSTELRLKATILRETLERGGVRAPEEMGTLAGEPWGYRNRVRLAFDATGRLGYRGRRSHAVVPIEECPIAAPLLVRAALAFAEVARENAPVLRPAEIALFCNAEETALLASVTAAAQRKSRFDAWSEDWRAHVPELCGIEWLLEGRSGLQARVASRWGVPSIVYRAAEFDYRVDQGAFFQVNRWLIDALAERVTAGRSGALAWDLFAGVGLFARRLTASFSRVVAVESAPASTQALAANLKHTRGAPVRATTLDFLRREHAGARPDFIVVDPPRAGLGAAVTAALVSIAAPSMVYVSCDPATLARDLRALGEGGYAIDSVTLVDLFPRTFHLETVVELRRA
ncbi:MAG TPA: 23S rRNA (uracil(1939)-C(5))-methyltransferase RlmD [Terracidiphilus sp.]|jgi:23S rRNA (uracil1939-C5)-methyltransferase|nr:23S rRNA (uracil(1939)-C(5))-methyltransferase RlmD [Terracidiphilus sp.]